MKDNQIQQYFNRIDKLVFETEPLFGKMTVNQMICHCTDFYRMAKGSKKANIYGKISGEQIIRIAKSGKSAPAPDGFGQVEGDGTKPIDWERDISTLKEYILAFSKLPLNYEFAEHPYFGVIDHERWHTLSLYHLNHHLKQFGV